MTQDGYPTEKELDTIQEWQADDLHGLMAYVRERWQYAESGYWHKDGDIYRVSTAGWSGNEEIILAMMSNAVWWAMFWQSSERGGHHEFEPLARQHSASETIRRMPIINDPAIHDALEDLP